MSLIKSRMSNRRALRLSNIEIVRTDLPHGFSTVVLSWKAFSKLYRLSTSSFSVSSSIQPLKLGNASGAGG